jgi:drug/metabolite transporter (DMT)-like permease
MTSAAASAAPSSHATRLALLALLAGAIALGGSGVWVKLSEIGPSATGFYRMAFAVPVFWLFVGLRGLGPRRAAAARPAGRRDAVLLLAAGALFAGDILTWHWALQYTSVANGTLLGNLAPIFVTFGAWALYGERASPGFLLGLAVAIAGAAVLMGDSLAIGRENLFGDALCIVTAVFYAGYLMVLAELRRRLATATIMLWSTAVSAVIVLPAALLAGESLAVPTLAGWAILAGLALVSQAGGQGMIAYALAHLSAAFSSVALLVQPVAAALIAWAVLGEAVGPWQALGGAVVLAGIALARRGSNLGAGSGDG